MKFFEKLGKLFAANVVYTVVLVIGLILFMYFANGDLIAGLFTAISALIVYVSIALLYAEYKKMPSTVAKAPAKPAVKKTASKKKSKK